jgi:hypothetical protein
VQATNSQFVYAFARNDEDGDLRIRPMLLKLPRDSSKALVEAGALDDLNKDHLGYQNLVPVSSICCCVM